MMKELTPVEAKMILVEGVIIFDDLIKSLDKAFKLMEKVRGDDTKTDRPKPDPKGKGGNGPDDNPEQ